MCFPIPFPVLFVFLFVLCIEVGASAAPGKTQAGPPAKVRIAGLVIPKVGFEREKNYQAFEKLARQAAESGATVVCTPEGFLEGYIVQSKGLTRDAYRDMCEDIPGGAYVKRMRDLARELSIYIVPGFAEKDADRQYNTAVIISPQGEVVGKFRKVHNAGDEPFNTTGTTFPVFQLPFAKVGMMICYDRQYPESPRLMSVNGSQIIFNPSSGMHGGINDTMMVTRAYENGVYIAFVHPEDCLIINPHGDIIARYDGKNRVVIADLDLSLVGHGAISGRKPHLYQDLAK